MSWEFYERKHFMPVGILKHFTTVKSRKLDDEGHAVDLGLKLLRKLDHSSHGSARRQKIV